MEKFSNEIIVCFLGIHITNKAVGFGFWLESCWQFPLSAISWEEGGDTMKETFKHSFFSLYCCQQHVPLDLPFLNVHLVFYLSHRFLQCSPGLWFSACVHGMAWLVLRFLLSRMRWGITKLWRVVLHKILLPAPVAFKHHHIILPSGSSPHLC